MTDRSVAIAGNVGVGHSVVAAALQEKTDTMGYELMEQSHGNVVGVHCTGKITKEDYTTFLEPTLDAVVAEHGSVRLIFKMLHFEGIELKAAWHDTVTGVKHAKNFERVAMIGNKNWEAGLLAIAKPFLKAQVRYFDISEESLAWKWIDDGTEGVVDLAAAPAAAPLGSGSGRKFLVAVDGSAAAIAAVEHAVSFMDLDADQLLLVAVHSEGEDAASAVFLEAAKALVTKEAENAKVALHNIEGDPARAILAVATEHSADYICMGSRAKTVVDRLLGSVTDKVLKGSICPVLIVPPPKDN